MTVYALFFEKTPFLDNNGKPLSGGMLYTYTAGSSTPKPTYTEADGLTANPNPVVLNSRGEVPSGIYGNTGAYKLVLQDSLGNTIWTRDNVTGINDVSGAVSEWQAVSQAVTYVSAASFSLTGDQTSTFHNSRRVRITDGGGTKYGYVSSSVFSVGVTTVTVTLDSGTIASSLASVQVGLLRADTPSVPEQCLPEGPATLKNKVIQSANSNTVEATSGPGNSPFAFRNKIINGNAGIQQRSTVSVSAAAQYGPDRWLGAVSGGTGISGNFIKSGFGGSSSGYGIYISTASFTNGQPYFAQRMEAANVTDLNGKTVTVSGKIYHDAGTSQNFVARLQKANSADNFGATTVLGTSSNIAAASGSVTPFTATFTLGASDATNGLVLEIYTASTLTVANKNFAISDIQLESGAVATPFEFRPIGTELALCQRYYQSGYACAIGYAAGAGSLNGAWGTFPVVMRAAPTLVNTGAPVSSNVSAVTFDTPTVNGFRYYVSATAAGGVSALNTWSASAEL